jgi:hypothetical protein
MKFNLGDIIIYTDNNRFTEFLGEVGRVEDQTTSSTGQSQVTVRWLNKIEFQGIPADRSKFPSSSFDKLSMNVQNLIKN